MPCLLLPFALLTGGLVDLNHTGRYVHWGFIQISVANLIVIGLMVVVFVAAVLIPFKRPGRRQP
jgi:hypothetical protein